MARTELKGDVREPRMVGMRSGMHPRETEKLGTVLALKNECPRLATPELQPGLELKVIMRMEASAWREELRVRRPPS